MFTPKIKNNLVFKTLVFCKKSKALWQEKRWNLGYENTFIFLGIVKNDVLWVTKTITSIKWGKRSLQIKWIVVVASGPILCRPVPSRTLERLRLTQTRPKLGPGFFGSTRPEPTHCGYSSKKKFSPFSMEAFHGFCNIDLLPKLKWRSASVS